MNLIKFLLSRPSQYPSIKTDDDDVIILVAISMKLILASSPPLPPPPSNLQIIKTAGLEKRGPLSLRTADFLSPDAVTKL